MPITAPTTDPIGLAQKEGSSIRPAESYAKPAVPLEDPALQQLARMTTQLGTNLTNIGEQRAQLQEQQDQQQIDYHVSRIRHELGTNTVNDVQLGALLPESSAIVRSTVAQKLGQNAAEEYMTAQKEALLQDPALRLNPELMDQKLKQIEADAAERAKGNPFWGAGFVRGVQGYSRQIREAAQGERSKFYDQQQQEGLEQEYDARVRQNRGGKIPSFLQVSPSATKIMALEGDNLTRPLAVARTLLDTNEREHAEVIARFIKEGTGKDVDPRVTPWCAYIVDAVLGKAGLPTLNSGRAADFANYGKDATADPQRGDIVVFNPLAKGSSGHVGFLVKRYEDGSVDVLSGNDDNGVHVSHYSAKSIRTIRRPGEGQFAQDAQRLSNGGTPSDFVQRISYAESTNDPNAKNPNSSATGLAQFIDSTWLGYVKKYRPDLAEGKSDAQVLALRSDPKISQEMAGKYAEDNSKVLTTAGLPVNNTNLALAHQFDGKGAVKILKADDGTPVEQVLSPQQIKANRLEGLTVGELKEQVATKMGAPVDGKLALQNGSRQLDRQYSRTSSLDEIRRRDITANYALKQAIQTGDTAYLDAFPPELQTPAIRGAFADARRKVDELQRRQTIQKREDDAFARAEDERKAIDEINKLEAEGQPIDPRKYAGNNKAYNYALGIKDQARNISPVDSRIQVERFVSDVEKGAVTGDYSHILGDEYKSKTPDVRQLQDIIRNRTDISPADKLALISNLDKVMETGTVARSPDVTSYYDRNLSGWARGLGMSIDADLQKKLYGVNPEGLAQKYFEGEVHSRVKDYVVDHGSMPRGSAMREILEKSEERTRLKVTEAVGSATNVKPPQAQGSTGSTPAAPAPVPSVPAGGVKAEKQADGKIKLTPKGNTPAAPAATPAAPSPAQQAGELAGSLIAGPKN